MYHKTKFITSIQLLHTPNYVVQGKLKSVNSAVGECSKCNAEVKLSRCCKSVHVKFEVERSWR